MKVVIAGNYREYQDWLKRSGLSPNAIYRF